MPPKMQLLQNTGVVGGIGKNELRFRKESAVILRRVLKHTKSYFHIPFVLPENHVNYAVNALQSFSLHFFCHGGTLKYLSAAIIMSYYIF